MSDKLKPIDNNEDIYDAPIKTSDAASMFRKKIVKNERPYTSECKKLNNRLVDRWRRDMLDRMSSNGTIRTSIVGKAWAVFYEGMSVIQAYKLYQDGVLTRTDSKVLNYWLDYFEKATLEQMHQLGHGTISFGWIIVTNELRIWAALEKYEKIYGVSDDPLVWYDKAFKNQDLMNGKITPFWNNEILKEVEEKVATILHIQVQPE